MKSWRVFLAVALMFASCGLASAATLVSQMDNPYHDGRQPSYLKPNGSGSYMADDFKFTTDAVIKEVSIYGKFYIDMGSGVCSATGMKVAFYTDNNGAPGNLVLEQTVNSFLQQPPTNPEYPGQYTADAEGIFKVDLNQDVAVSANTRYWMKAQIITGANNGNSFYWYPQGTNTNPNQYTPALGSCAATNGTNFYGNYWIDDFMSGTYRKFTDSFSTTSGSPSGLPSGWAVNDMSFALVGDAGTPPPPPTPEWNVNASGEWSNASNWVTGVPNDYGKTAILGSTITSKKYITADQSVILGTLNINNTNSYFINPGDDTASMTFAKVADGSGTAEINVDSGSHTLNLPVTFASNTEVSVAANSTLTLRNPVTVGSGKTITKSGDGLLDIWGRIDAGAVDIQAGSLKIGGQAVIASAMLSVGGTWQLTGTGLIQGSDVSYASTAASTFDGSIEGDATLSVGAGTLTLTGANTYGGGTTVSGGTLVVASAGALPAGKSLSIGSGGTLILGGMSMGASVNAAEPVPEPGTWALLASGLVGLAAFAWRRRK